MSAREFLEEEIAKYRKYARRLEDPTKDTLADKYWNTGYLAALDDIELSLRSIHFYRATKEGS